MVPVAEELDLKAAKSVGEKNIEMIKVRNCFAWLYPWRMFTSWYEEVFKTMIDKSVMDIDDIYF